MPSRVLVIEVPDVETEDAITTAIEEWNSDPRVTQVIAYRKVSMIVGQPIG